MNQELIPQRHKILEKSQQIAASNRQRLNDGLLTEFGTLQNRLTRMIFLALTTGLLLSLMSALYILRLERQAQRWHQELAAAAVISKSCPPGWWTPRRLSAGPSPGNCTMRWGSRWERCWST